MLWLPPNYVDSLCQGTSRKERRCYPRRLLTPIIRKKYIYYDTPELNEDEGRLQCEDEYEFLEWNDIDKFIEIAREEPEKIFLV